MSYPTSSVITWAKGSQGLAAIGEYKKKSLTGSSVDPDLYRKIYIERTSLEWQLSQNPTDSDNILVGQTNYVYDLCFPYMLEAQSISGSGGLVIDPVTSGFPDPYDFVVAASSTPIKDGDSSVTLSNFIGLNIIFNRSNVPQSTIDTGGSYYSWVKSTGLFTCFPAAVTGELFQIIPVG